MTTKLELRREVLDRRQAEEAQRGAAANLEFQAWVIERVTNPAVDH